MSTKLSTLLEDVATALRDFAVTSKAVHKSIYNTNPEPITDTEIANWLLYFTNTFPKYTFKVNNVTKYSIIFSTNVPEGFNLAPHMVCGINDKEGYVTIFIRPTLKKGSMYVVLTEDMKLKPVFANTQGELT